MAILVAGGSKGIGRSIALRFARPGNEVFINYHSDDAAAKQTAKEVEATGAKAYIMKYDVGTPDGARSLIADVQRSTSKLDQLVHCAVRPVSGPALEIDPQLFTDAIVTNGVSVLYLVQAALPLLQRGSSVFFLSSRGSSTAVPNYAALGSAKALAESLIRYLAVELAPRGVRANVVSAGALDTAAFRAVIANPEERLKAAAASNPSGRGLNFDDVTGLIEFLASPDASMIQGQVIMIDGGASLKPF